MGFSRELALGLAYGASVATDATILVLTPAMLIASMMGTSIAGSIAIPALQGQTEPLGGAQGIHWLTRASMVATGAAVVLGGVVQGFVAVRFDATHSVAWGVTVVVAGGGFVAASWVSGWMSALAHRRGRFVLPAWGEVALGLVGTGVIVAGKAAGMPAAIYSIGLFVGGAANAAISFVAAGVTHTKPTGVRADEPSVSGGAITARAAKVWSIAWLGHLNLVGERIVAAALPPGVVSALYYGRKLATTLASLIGGSLSLRVFPRIVNLGESGRRGSRGLLVVAATGATAAFAFAIALALPLVPFHRLAGGEVARQGIAAFLWLSPLMAAFLVAHKFAHASSDLASALRASAILGSVTVGGYIAVARYAPSLPAVVSVTGVGLLASLIYLLSDRRRGIESNAN